MCNYRRNFRNGLRPKKRPSPSSKSAKPPASRYRILPPNHRKKRLLRRLPLPRYNRKRLENWDSRWRKPWADPSKQTKPSAWSSLNFNDLKIALADYTTSTLITLKTNGITPEWVQVGNETDNGMFIRLINAQAYFDKLKMDANSLPVCFFIDKNNNVVEIKTAFPEPAGKNNVDNLKEFESVLEKLI